MKYSCRSRTSYTYAYVHVYVIWRPAGTILPCYVFTSSYISRLTNLWQESESNQVEDLLARYCVKYSRSEIFSVMNYHLVYLLVMARQFFLYICVLSERENEILSKSLNNVLDVWMDPSHGKFQDVHRRLVHFASDTLTINRNQTTTRHSRWY